MFGSKVMPWVMFAMIVFVFALVVLYGNFLMSAIQVILVTLGIATIVLMGVFAFLRDASRDCM